jgi:hypothetical protein
MNKLFILITLFAVSYVSYAQEAKSTCTKSACDKSCCDKPSCCKSSCGSDGTKKADASVITIMRNDLETVIAKMSTSSISFNKEIAELKIEKGTCDDECLLNISKAASTVRYELLNKVEPSRLTASLKNFKPGNFSNKRKMVSGLKKEIELLTTQVAKL